MLARHCEAAGRPCHEIEKTVSARLERARSPAAFAEALRGVGRLGIEHAVVITTGAWTTDAVATLAAAVQEVDALAAD